jgi:hypothetical protein
MLYEPNDETFLNQIDLLDLDDTYKEFICNIQKKMLELQCQT